MNYSDLIKAIAKESNIDSGTVDTVLKNLTDTITSTLKSGDSVTLPSFATFKPSLKAARTARNPKTGAPIEVAAKNSVKITLGKGLKDALNR